jgi:hypothetical protein
MARSLASSSIIGRDALHDLEWVVRSAEYLISTARSNVCTRTHARRNERVLLVRRNGLASSDFAVRCAFRRSRVRLSGILSNLPFFLATEQLRSPHDTPLLRHIEKELGCALCTDQTSIVYDSRTSSRTRSPMWSLCSSPLVATKVSQEFQISTPLANAIPAPRHHRRRRCQQHGRG